LPTLAHVTGQKAPTWGEGILLPELGGKYDAERSTFSMDAKTNPAFAPLNTLSLAMRKGKYKLIYYKNLRNQPDSFELYDMENDPQELTDIYPTDAIAAPLKDELLAKLDSVNKKYQKA
jgi:arylsulfatase A-like enzyme